jgi:hypothetical protein
MYPFFCGLALGFLLIGMGVLIGRLWDRIKAMK